MFKKIHIGILVVVFSGSVFANPANEIMLGLPSNKQDMALRQVVESANETCPNVTKKLFQGQDKKGNAIWSVACSNGRSFSVMIYNDASGSTKVADCNVLKIVGVKCFAKF